MSSGKLVQMLPAGIAQGDGLAGVISFVARTLGLPILGLALFLMFWQEIQHLPLSHISII